jgi:thiamine kinase-like enzyme
LNVIKSEKHHLVLDLPERILKNELIFKKRTVEMYSVLKDLREREDEILKTLIHGDLRKKNMRTNSNGNYYIDFEYFGVASPMKDLATLILESPMIKDEIILKYKKNMMYDFPKMQENLYEQVIFRASEVLIAMKNRSLDTTYKENIRKKFLGVVDCF